MTSDPGLTPGMSTDEQSPPGEPHEDEHTRLTFPGDPTARALPLKNYTTPYEWYYQTLPVSKLDPKRNGD